VIVRSAFADSPGIRHAFFTCEGGVSEGIYASLNCGFGSDDDPERVAENRRRALAALGMPKNDLLTVHQVHSADALVVDSADDLAHRPRADAMVTATPGLTLGILTADCAPVLLADPEAGVIGAAHAGWRGALSGILAATVERMLVLGARRDALRAAVGPAIGHASYEVGPDFPAPFLAEDESNAAYFEPAPRQGHHLFDLAGYVAAALRRAGVADIDVVAADTYRDERFFSYRRNTHRGVGDYGRQLSAITLVS